MPRVKRGTIANKRRRNILAQTKGFRHGRKSKLKFAKEAILHSGEHSYKHRRVKKRDFRALWQMQINAAARANGLTYSTFMNLCKKAKVEMDRKVLATIAKDQPEVFAKIIAKVK